MKMKKILIPLLVLSSSALLFACQDESTNVKSIYKTSDIESNNLGFGYYEEKYGEEEYRNVIKTYTVDNMKPYSVFYIANAAQQSPIEATFTECLKALELYGQYLEKNKASISTEDYNTYKETMDMTLNYIKVFEEYNKVRDARQDTTPLEENFQNTMYGFEDYIQSKNNKFVLEAVIKDLNTNLTEEEIKDYADFVSTINITELDSQLYFIYNNLSNNDSEVIFEDYSADKDSVWGNLFNMIKSPKVKESLENPNNKYLAIYEELLNYYNSTEFDNLMKEYLEKPSDKKLKEMLFDNEHYAKFDKIVNPLDVKNKKYDELRLQEYFGVTRLLNIHYRTNLDTLTYESETE